MIEIPEAELRKHLIVAADVSSQNELSSLMARVGRYVGGIKVGLELQTAVGGRMAVSTIRRAFDGGKAPGIMYDIKLNDTPTTMARTTEKIADLAPWAFTVHASAGVAGMKAAVANKGGVLMLAVTVLTTMDDRECHYVYGGSIRETVVRFADDALDCGADGLVCSPNELTLLGRHSRFDHLVKVVPNVRPKWAVIPGDDQNPERGMTPKEAIIAGGPKTRLVMGRPITGTFPDVNGGPAANVARILQEIEEGLRALA